MYMYAWVYVCILIHIISYYTFLLANDICSTIDNNYRRPDIDYVIALYKM